MSSIAAIPRSHLTMLLCLPLAILVGFILGEPADSGGILLITLLLAVISIPAFMRWHHPLLILSCNAVINPFFLPGRPPLWLVAAVISMFFLLLDRSVGHRVNFFKARQISMSLIFLLIVVFATAYLTGGLGMSSLGSSSSGGKHYMFIAAAAMIYFALSTISISRENANLAVGGFFLSFLTGAIGYIASWGGAVFNYLIILFPIEGVLNESSSAEADVTGNSYVRYGGLSLASIGLFCYILARFGIRGMLDITKPWRLLLFLLAITGCLYSGFRTNMILFMLTFGILFCVEGLLRTKYFVAVLVAVTISAMVILPNIQKMPLTIQRTLCFLPIKVDAYVQAGADDSTDWRLNMWRELYPTVPDYLLKGKGLSISQEDVYKVSQALLNGYGKTWEISILTGEYHSGPLSLIIPFGLFGVAGFLWFIWASIRMLHQNYRYGDPALKTINSFLLSYFIAQFLFYVFIFGSFYANLMIFTSMAGLSVSLNGGIARPLPRLSPDEARMN